MILLVVVTLKASVERLPGVWEMLIVLPVALHHHQQQPIRLNPCDWY